MPYRKAWQPAFLMHDRCGLTRAKDSCKPRGTSSGRAEVAAPTFALGVATQEEGAVLLKANVQSAAKFEQSMVPVVQEHGGFMDFWGRTDDSNKHGIGEDSPDLRPLEHHEITLLLDIAVFGCLAAWCGILAVVCLRPATKGTDKCVSPGDVVDDSQRHSRAPMSVGSTKLLANLPERMLDNVTISWGDDFMVSTACDDNEEIVQLGHSTVETAALLQRRGADDDGSFRYVCSRAFSDPFERTP